jgi:hypothetical protein
MLLYGVEIMPRSALEVFYGLNKPLEKKAEMEKKDTGTFTGYCCYCGCGSFEMRMQKMHTIRTRLEESYIIRKCKSEDCRKDQQPLI